MATELADASAWPAMIDGLLERASALPPDALIALFADSVDGGRASLRMNG